MCVNVVLRLAREAGERFVSVVPKADANRSPFQFQSRYRYIEDSMVLFGCRGSTCLLGAWKQPVIIKEFL